MTSPPPVSRDDQTLLPEGEVLGEHFRIGDLLGRGGMAEVFAAYDTDLRRNVAVKVSKTGVDPEFLTREGRLLADVRHPGILSIYSMGLRAGHRYLVLERLLGATLDEHLRHRGDAGFPLEYALNILIQLCDVVAAMHGAGVIHRDLKPGNIMVVPGGRVVLFDFGVARSPTIDVIGDDEMIVGTPDYMAPEIPKGSAPNPSHDIYALGCVAFQLVTGQVPFKGATPMEVMVAHLDHDVPRLGDHVQVPPLLEQVVGSMLAKDPAQRFRSVGAVGSWLRGIERGRTEEAAEDPMVSVLVVDDEDDFRVLLATVVESRLSNAQVRTAGDGRDALGKFLIEPPDIMLFDLEMPIMNGFELAMHVAGMPEARGVIMCAITGRAVAKDRQLLAQAGVHHFISKRSPPEEITTTIHSLVAEVAARKRLGRK